MAIKLFGGHQIFFTTIQTNPFYYTSNKDKDFISQPRALNSKNIYLLIFDCVPLPRLIKNGEIDKDFFPTFHRLSEEWAWYRNATTNGTSTSSVRPMLFSGRYYDKKLMFLKGFDDTLFSKVGTVLNSHFFFDERIFQENQPGGFTESIKHAIWLNQSLFEAYVTTSIAPPLNGYILGLFSSWKFDWRGETPEEFLGKKELYHGNKSQQQFFNFLEEIDQSSGKSGNFFLLWSMIPHYPFIYDEKGNIIQEPKYDRFVVGMGKEDIQRVIQNQLKVLQYTDSLMGIFLRQLEESGLYEDAIIFVLSDHGLSETGTNYDINEQVFRIPFFLKAPGLPTGTDDRDVQTVDITPTIVDMLGMSLSAEYDGQSLLRPYSKRDKIIYTLGVSGFRTLQNEETWWRKY